MKVELLDYTGKGREDAANYAASLLIFTKNTRLNMTANLFEEIQDWPWSKKEEELQYMARTIPSSHEFIGYMFNITGVSRAFTHQFVRTRTFSFAQQTHRILNVGEGRGWEYLTGPSIKDDQELKDIYDYTMQAIDNGYKRLVAGGAKIEDARGVLPTNILTNINASCNMRNFVETVRKRSTDRVQGEYRDVLEAMKAEVLKVHPFVSFFIERTFDKAAHELNELLRQWPDQEKATAARKLLDSMWSQS